LNLWLAGLIIVVSIAVSVTVMLFVRRRAPVGGFFSDSDRAAGVFGVLGTSFAVLLAFVIFLAFQSYGNAKEKAGQEAITITELYHTARVFPPRQAALLEGQLICYARAVIADEWRTMRDDRQSPLVERWIGDLDHTIERLDVSGSRQATAYNHLFMEHAERREGRRGRLAEAAPFVPPPLWLVLSVGALFVLVFMAFYADRGEGRITQALMMGAVTAVVVSGLLVVRFLDKPYEGESGSIEPVEMRRTLEAIDREQQLSGERIRPPCDTRGAPSPS
jgi:hypothetical protein